MKVRRVFVSLCLLLVLATSLPMQAYGGQATQPTGATAIAPFWTHIHSIFVSLDIVNGRALMAGSVLAQLDTERISVDVLLERVNPNGTTTHIASWDNIEATGFLWAWERPHFVARGHYYRLTLTATAFRHGTSETVSLSRTSWAN